MTFHFHHWDCPAGEQRGGGRSHSWLLVLFLRASKLSDLGRGPDSALAGCSGRRGAEKLVRAGRSCWDAPPRSVAGLGGCEGDRQGPDFYRLAFRQRTRTPAGTRRALGSHAEDKSPGFLRPAPQLSGSGDGRPGGG